jgi:hypothetical protein
MSTRTFCTSIVYLRIHLLGTASEPERFYDNSLGSTDYSLCLYEKDLRKSILTLDPHSDVTRQKGKREFNSAAVIDDPIALTAENEVRYLQSNTSI